MNAIQSTPRIFWSFPTWVRRASHGQLLMQLLEIARRKRPLVAGRPRSPASSSPARIEVSPDLASSGRSRGEK